MRPTFLIAGLVLATACSESRMRSGPDLCFECSNSSVCGNDRVEHGEVCDGLNTEGWTCLNLGFGPGPLGCTDDCTDLDRSSCGAPPTCGNGVREGGEVCDGRAFGPRTCASYGYSQGALSCSENCGVIDSSGCSVPLPQCGNGLREPGEVCDGADLGGATCQSLGFGEGTVTCRLGCASLDTSGCSPPCTPQCGRRICGPDPVCGVSCGTCTDAICTDEGFCDPIYRGPSILRFTTSVSELTAGQSVRFSASVWDPDGAADFVEGTLEDNSGHVFGAFGSNPNNTSFSYFLSWDDMNLATPIDFTTDEQRKFLARFHDMAGNEVSQLAQLRLHCDGDAACGGDCVDLSADEAHCGQCNHACANGSECTGGACLARQSWTPATLGSCQDTCTSAYPGSTCAPRCELGVGAPAAAVATYSCTSGACDPPSESYTYGCAEIPSPTLTRADGSVMSYDSGECCCMLP